MKTLFRALLLSSAVGIAAGTSAATATHSLDLASALSQVEDKHPSLQAFPYQLRAEEGRREQAGQRPAPRLSLDVDNVLGSGAFNGSDQAEVSLMLSQTIELGGKRERREQLAQLSLNTLEAQYREARLSVLSDTAGRYYQVLRLQDLQSVWRKRAGREAEALQLIERQVQAGAAGKADAHKMRLRWQQSNAQLAQLRAQFDNARWQLASMWLAQPDFTRVSGRFAQLPAIPSAAQVRAAVDTAPQHLRLQLLSKLANAELQLQQAQGRSNVNVGVGIKHFSAGSERALMFSASMPLAFSNTNRGNIARALAERDLSVQQSQWLRQQLELQLLQAQRRLQAQVEQAQRLEQQLLPQAETLLNAMQAGYRQGQYSVLQWVDAQTEAFAVEAQLIETRAQVFIDILELERMTGQPLAALQSGAFQ